MKLNYYILVFSVVILAACEYNFPEVNSYTEKDFGTINAEKTVAFGDDFLAGVMDGALYSAGQENSVPAIIASQLSEISEVTFNQPLINSENGFNIYKNSSSDIFGKWIYKYRNTTDDEPVLTLTAGESVSAYSGDKTALNNLAVPLSTVNGLSAPDFSGNPYFSRIYSEGSSLAEQIAQKSPTLIIGWIGMNDYLNYAYQGAINPDLFSSTDDFENNFSALVEKLMQNTQAKLVLGNLISFDDFPFFYLRQYNFIRITNAQKSMANSVFSAFNKAVSAYNIGKSVSEMRPYISFEDNGSTLYPQPIVIIDESLSDATYPDGTPLEKYRQLNENEMALFSITDEMVENGYGWAIPLDESFYLNANQIEEIKSRVENFNQILTEMAQRYSDRILVVDVAGAVNKVADTGKYDSWGVAVSSETIYEDGVPLEGGIDMNSIFSLDAIHFNQRGNAFIANEFIQAMNIAFGSNIPKVQINDYIGNLYEF